MKVIAACFLLALGTPVFASITSLDFVKIKNGNRDEAVFYYENNWLKYRIEARRVGVIESFELLVADSTDADIDIVLVTVYKDAEQFENREANFESVMSRAGSDDAQLLNEVQPGDFREVTSGAEYTSIP